MTEIKIKNLAWLMNMNEISKYSFDVEIVALKIISKDNLIKIVMNLSIFFLKVLASQHLRKVRFRLSPDLLDLSSF